MRIAGFFEPAARRRPRPPVSIDLERTLPAWVLRGTSAAVVLLGLLPVLNDPITPVLAAVAVVLLPHPGTVAALTVLAMFYVWSLPPDLLRCATFLLVLHLVHVLVRLTAPLPATGRVEWRLIGRALAGFAVIQLIAQLMVGIAFTAAEGLPVMPWFAVLAVALIAAAVLAGVRWVSRHTS